MKKILVVDDEKDIVTVLGMALERSGYETYHAHDGESAFNIIREKRPDAVVLDIMMPKMDGHTLVTKLKESPGLSKIPVIVMTGRGHLRELLEVNGQLTVAGYLEKPFSVKVLVDKVKEILEK